MLTATPQTELLTGAARVDGVAIPMLLVEWIVKQQQLLKQQQRLIEEQQLAQESSGPAQSLQGKRCHLLEINGLVTGGQLRLDWTYSKNLYRRATIESLAQSFEEALLQIIAHCQSPEAGGYTPSDFSLAQLDQEKLDEVLGRVEF